MATRNLAVEKNAVDKFIQQRGKKPETPQDWAIVHRISYPTLDVLPEELKSNPGTMSYYQSTGAASPASLANTSNVQGLSQTVADSNVDQLRTDMNTAGARSQELAGGNEPLRILQEAIREKSGVKQAPIGESEIFKQAGVGGYGALSSSLAARKNEIQTNMVDFQNSISQMAGTYSDMAKQALSAYTQSADAYNKEVDRLQKIIDDQNDQAQAIELINHKAKVDEALLKLQRSIPTISEQQDLLDKGYTLDSNGLVTDPAKKIVQGIDLSTYAADPNHAQAVASLVSGMDFKGDIANVDAYIKAKNSDSPITGEMISQVSQKYGLPWEILVALQEQESWLGTSPVALKNNNLGGITYSENYVNNHPGTSKGTARPAKEGGNYVKFPTVQAGLEAVAEQLARRRTTTTMAKTEDITGKPASYQEWALAGGKTGTGKTYEDWVTKEAKKPTESQFKVATFVKRLEEADVVLDLVEGKFTGGRSYIGEQMPNIFKTVDRQKMEQAQRNFINATLRRESGANITDSEYANAKQQYFAAPGDSKEVLEQKRANRETLKKGFKEEAGTAYITDGLTNEDAYEAYKIMISK
jgi:hypothetical protein